MVFTIGGEREEKIRKDNKDVDDDDNDGGDGKSNGRGEWRRPMEKRK